jgi:hypothetical protein
MINRVMILTMKNHRFSKLPEWGHALERMHHGRTRTEDIEVINTRVARPNLSLTTFEELEGSAITYACSTYADRNLISDNIFENI